MFELRQQHRAQPGLLLLFATYWDLALTAPAAAHPGITQTRMGHACEWETSMLLQIAPQLVGDVAAVPPVKFGNAFEPATRGWAMPDRSAPGHIGDARHATAEKAQRCCRSSAPALPAWCSACCSGTAAAGRARVRRAARCIVRTSAPVRRTAVRQFTALP